MSQVISLWISRRRQFRFDGRKFSVKQKNGLVTRIDINTRVVVVGYWSIVR